MRYFGWLALVVGTATTTTATAMHDFIPHHSTKNCSGDVHSSPWNEKITGVNVGGWLVLEPWITPSLFYQFLGKHSTDTAMDTYSFCKVLGPEEANKQLRRHWETWVTEEHVARLASFGVNALRLPVGDWMYAPYPPFIGCTDGALEEVDRLLGLARKYGMGVLFDVHALRGSANGLDNGGITMSVKWTATLKDVATDAVTFEHWPRRSASWVGDFDRHTGTYPTVNWTHISQSIDMIGTIAEMYGKNPDVLGIEPVNEPWQFTPIDVLKQFYWDAYLRVKAIAPHWRFVMHDSFRFDPAVWGGFMAGCPDIALDTHIYQAWSEPSTRANFYTNACAQKDVIEEMERAFGPVIVGEWSLATDNCAMWLNGFNDNLPGYPKLPCKLVPCAQPYMGSTQPGAPPSVLKPLQGPFGTGVSGPQYGLCPVDRDWLKKSPSDELGGVKRERSSKDLSPEAESPEEDDTDVVMRHLASKKLQAFGTVAHGFFFWNFRTELEDQWSYLRAVERGWFPRDARTLAQTVANACDLEDVHCEAKPTATEAQLKDAIAFADPSLSPYEDDLSDEDLRKLANKVFDNYWVLHRNEDRLAACDFEGAAQITETPYKCIARRVEERATRDGMAYCVSYDPKAIEFFDSLSGDALYRQADVVFDEFWEAHRYEGATCDFGGGATLVVAKRLARQNTAAAALNRQESQDTSQWSKKKTLDGSLAAILAALPLVALVLVVKARNRRDRRKSRGLVIHTVNPERIPLSRQQQQAQ